MTNYRKLEIRLFGVFRSLSPSAHCVLKVQGGETVQEIKRLLCQRLGEFQEHTPQALTYDLGGLIAKSVLASEFQVLADSEIIQVETRLALLPPVSGG
jgi:molybdopterin converting factor small subunit